MPRSLILVTMSALLLCLPGLGGLNQPQTTAPSKQPILQPAANPDDVRSIDGILVAYYASTSGPAGQARDWARFKSLFLPEAHLIAARPNSADGSGATPFIMTVDNYIASNRTYFEKGGFFDSEVARRTERFGNIASVLSTYASRRIQNAPDPYSRGLNSFQLLFDGKRWWIAAVLWEFERADNPLPERYLQTENHQ